MPPEIKINTIFLIVLVLYSILYFIVYTYSYRYYDSIILFNNNNLYPTIIILQTFEIAVRFFILIFYIVFFASLSLCVCVFVFVLVS